MLAEVVGGALLGKVLSGNSAKKITKTAKKYAVICDNKVDGKEILNAVYISTDKAEACVWVDTAVKLLAHLTQSNINNRIDADGAIYQRTIERNNIQMSYVVFAM